MPQFTKTRKSYPNFLSNTSAVRLLNPDLNNRLWTLSTSAPFCFRLRQAVHPAEILPYRSLTVPGCTKLAPVNYMRFSFGTQGTLGEERSFSSAASLIRLVIQESKNFS